MNASNHEERNDDSVDLKNAESELVKNSEPIEAIDEEIVLIPENEDDNTEQNEATMSRENSEKMRGYVQGKAHRVLPVGMVMVHIQKLAVEPIVTIRRAYLVGWIRGYLETNKKNHTKDEVKRIASALRKIFPKHTLKIQDAKPAVDFSHLQPIAKKLLPRPTYPWSPEPRPKKAIDGLMKQYGADGGIGTLFRMRLKQMGGLEAPPKPVSPPKSTPEPKAVTKPEEKKKAA